ncbi:hypothetical protein BC628DRAFT_1401455 [Trametes gibbosa]|nr:hypothetical protein BC628DRAFT_1401455 [Trametes gibbosa]
MSKPSIRRMGWAEEAFVLERCAPSASSCHTQRARPGRITATSSHSRPHAAGESCHTHLREEHEARRRQGGRTAIKHIGSALSAHLRAESASAFESLVCPACAPHRIARLASHRREQVTKSSDTPALLPSVQPYAQLLVLGGALRRTLALRRFRVRRTSSACAALGRVSLVGTPLRPATLQAPTLMQRLTGPPPTLGLSGPFERPPPVPVDEKSRAPAAVVARPTVSSSRARSDSGGAESVENWAQRWEAALPCQRRLEAEAGGTNLARMYRTLKLWTERACWPLLDVPWSGLQVVMAAVPRAHPAFHGVESSQVPSKRDLLCGVDVQQRPTIGTRTRTLRVAMKPNTRFS